MTDSATHTDMTARDVMTRSPDTIQSTDSIAHGIELIMKHRYRALPVVDKGCVYLGVFGVNCLLKLVLPKAVQIDHGLTSVPFVSTNLTDLHAQLKSVKDKPVSTCMKQNATVVSPDTPLLETLLVLYKTRMSIPVVNPDTGCLEGMISYWDVGTRILDQDSNGHD